MLVKEIIEELQKCDPELDVLIFADHGQTHDQTYSVNIIYIDPDLEGSCDEEEMKENLQEDPEYYEDYFKVVEIEGC